MTRQIKLSQLNYKLFSALLFSLLSVLIVSSLHDTARAYHEQTTYLTYQANNGIKINHPNDWVVEEKEGSIYLTSPSHDERDTILESLDITVSPSYGATPADFATFLADKWYVENLERFELNEEKYTNVNGRSTYILVYTFMDSNIGNAKSMDIIIGHSNNFYILTYTADPLNYYNYLPIIKTMVDSFEIVEDPTGGIGEEDPTGGIGEEDPTGGIGEEDPTGGIVEEDPTGGIGENSTGGIGENSTGGIDNSLRI